ncbi:MAG: hypothetical protein H6832_14925 [Planctomycetes bacterium]|nr:hypothetical protein [Planctomycetota bacterium]
MNARRAIFAGAIGASLAFAVALLSRRSPDVSTPPNSELNHDSKNGDDKSTPSSLPTKHNEDNQYREISRPDNAPRGPIKQQPPRLSKLQVDIAKSTITNILGSKENTLRNAERAMNADDLDSIETVERLRQSIYQHREALSMLASGEYSMTQPPGYPFLVIQLDGDNRVFFDLKSRGRSEQMEKNIRSLVAMNTDVADFVDSFNSLSYEERKAAAARYRRSEDPKETTRFFRSLNAYRLGPEYTLVPIH